MTRPGNGEAYSIQAPGPHGPGYRLAGSPVSCRQLEADAAIVPPSYTPDKCCRCRLFSENLKHFFIFTEFSNSSTFTLHFISFSSTYVLYCNTGGTTTYPNVDIYTGFPKRLPEGNFEIPVTGITIVFNIPLNKHVVGKDNLPSQSHKQWKNRFS